MVEPVSPIGAVSVGGKVICGVDPGTRGWFTTGVAVTRAVTLGRLLGAAVAGAAVAPGVGVEPELGAGEVPGAVAVAVGAGVTEGAGVGVAEELGAGVGDAVGAGVGVGTGTAQVGVVIVSLMSVT